VNPEEQPDAGAHDEVVATVGTRDEARPIVESLLLAGLGPSLRDVPAGVEVAVVAGQGARAREVLGLGDAVAPGSPLTGSRGAGTVTTGAPAGGLGPTGGGGDPTTDGSGPPVAARPRGVLFSAGDRSSNVRALVIFAVALVVVPAVAFYISFRVAGG